MKTSATGNPRSPEGQHFPILMGALFAALYAATLSLQWFTLRNVAVTEAKKQAADMTLMLEEHLDTSVPLWRLLDLVVEDPHYYDLLKEGLKEHLPELGLVTARFYDISGKVIFAEDRSLLGTDHSHKKLLQRARSGDIGTKIVAPKEYRDIYGTENFSSLVETYVPVRDSGGHVVYVYDAYQDFGPARGRMIGALGFTAVALAVLMTVAMVSTLWLTRKIRRLETEVDILEHILPICMYCKKIRVEGTEEPDRWTPVEAYYHEKDNTDFSHGICDECLEKHHPDLE